MSGGPANRGWGRAIVDGLARLGAGRFFASPGARGSALLAALAGRGGDVAMHYDERGAGFAALGWAMASGKPAVCLVTSGSAVANLLPACVEAFYSGIPLVLLTADRPPELRDKGANQTIRQVGLFGNFVGYSADLPCPGVEADFGKLFGVLREAMECATGENPGPVHLNVPFREPLLGGEEGVVELPEFGGGAPRGFSLPQDFDFGRFFSGRGVVLIGRLGAGEQAEAWRCVELAKRLGWAVVADALSGAKGLEGVVRHADWILQGGGVPNPERVLHFGGAFVSKRLGEWQAVCRGKDCVQVRLVPEKLDPWYQSPVLVRGGIAEFCGAVEGFLPKGGGVDSSWTQADEALGALLERMLDGEGPVSEPGIARVVSKIDGDLFLGNSMPVRDYDSCGFGVGGIFGNRGASGIDGNIATIAGVAMAGGRRLTAVLGDLAALHDLNSLPLLRGLPVALVVVNNDGGGIFRFLPLNVGAEERERLWETPHGFDFRQAAGQFGIRYAAVGTRAELEAELRGGKLPVLIECRTERAANHDLHRRIAEEVRQLGIRWS